MSVVDARTLLYQPGEFFLAVFHFPAVEVRSLLVVVVEHLREDSLVGGVAESFGGGADPAVGFGFLRQIGQCGVRFAVSLFGQIGVSGVFPAVLELLEGTAAAFGETGVANLSVGRQYLAAGSGNGLFHNISGCTCNALVALAMVVGAYIETCVVFSVVPANQLFVGLRKGRVVSLGFGDFLILLYLCQ